MTDETRESASDRAVGDDASAPDPCPAPAESAGEASGAEDTDDDAGAAAAPRAPARTAARTAVEGEGEGEERTGAGEDPGRNRLKRPRDAVIYVPGLAHGEYRVGVDTLALRIASALDRRARTRGARFGVSEAHVVEYREEVQSRRITIEREDPDRAAEPVIDVYEFDYRESIRERFEQRAPIRQAIAIAWLLVANSRGYWEFLWQRGKNWGDKLQLLLASGILALIVLYLAMLLVTAVGTGVQAMRAMSVTMNEDADRTPALAGAQANAPSDVGAGDRAPAAAGPGAGTELAAPADAPQAGPPAGEAATEPPPETPPATPSDADPSAATPATAARDASPAAQTTSEQVTAPPAAETPAVSPGGESVTTTGAQGAAAAPGQESGNATATPPTAGATNGNEHGDANGDAFSKGLELLASLLGLSDRYEQALRMLQGVVVLLTALGLLTRNSIKQLIADMSIEYAAVINYISSPVERPELNGRFMDLIEHVHESEVEYRHIDVIGFSFGSVVAIDCVFGQQPPAPGLSTVSTLTTVGSPFDIIRSFFPQYFRGRRLPGDGDGDLRWFNIFSPEDILSSNFRDDPSPTARCEIGVALVPQDGPAVGEHLKPEQFDTNAPMVVPQNMLYGPGGEAQRSWPWVRLARQREIHMAYWGKSARAVSFMADYIPARYAPGESPID